LACLADKPECVKALIVAGADVNIAASQTSAHASSSATPSECLGTFLHENPKKLHAEVCLFISVELQVKLIHSYRLV
jgi:calcium-independent phospholipase A2